MGVSRRLGYQLVQALYALGSGGVFGTGLGLGAPRYIPAVHTDFVIAAIGEELGLVGTLAVDQSVRAVHGARLPRRASARARVVHALLAAGLTADVGAAGAHHPVLARSKSSR